MGSKPLRHSAESVIAAIKGTGGVKAHIARKLNVSRWTLDNYIERWATVKEAYEEERAGVDDAALSVVINDIVTNRDVGSAKWWLSKKVPEFIDKQEIEQSGDITIKIKYADD